MVVGVVLAALTHISPRQSYAAVLKTPSCDRRHGYVASTGRPYEAAAVASMLGE
jgi:hypothetical protein